MKLNHIPNKFLKIFFALAFLFTSNFALGAVALPIIPEFAPGGTQGGGIPATPTSFAGIACIVIKLALSFIPYLVVMAAGAFLQGLIKYVAHGDDEEKMSEGRKLMIYGTFGFFFMVSIWGILKIFTNSFDIPFLIPQFNSDRSFICNK